MDQEPQPDILLTPAEVAERLRLDLATVMRMLETGRLPAYRVDKEWRIAATQLAAWLEARSNQNRPDERTKVERSFFRDGRLIDLPAQRRKRLIVLQRLLREFEIGRVYTEAEVNAVLRRFHHDFCTLRRELVDEKMMYRTAGKYMRAGSYKID